MKSESTKERMTELLKLFSYYGHGTLRLLENHPPEIYREFSWLPLNTNKPLTRDAIERMVSTVIGTPDREMLARGENFETEVMVVDLGTFFMRFTAPALENGFGLSHLLAVSFDIVSLEWVNIQEEKSLEEFTEEDKRKYYKRNKDSNFLFVFPSSGE